MVRWSLLYGNLVVEHYFFPLKLLAMLNAKWQARLAWDRILVQRKHLVGCDVKIPGIL